MNRLSRLDLLIAAAIAATLVAAALAGLPEMQGAHPWWARQAGIVGGIGGTLLWFVLRRVGVPASR